MSAFIDRWAEQLPNSDQPLVIRAMKLQMANNSADAIPLYEQALKINPRNVQTLNNLAWLYFQAKEKDAESLASRAYEMAPENPAVLDTYGWILANLGKPKEGVELLEKAVKLAPDAAEIREHLASAREMF